MPSLDFTEKASVRELVGWSSLLIVPPVLYFTGVFYGLTVQAALFLAILSVVILMWLFNLLDDYIPPMLGMFASLFFGLAPPPVALSGLASPSLLTLMGVFALASVITTSGLGRRFVLYLLLKVPDRLFWQQNILVCCGLLLSFVSPSGNSRVTLILPLFKEISEALKLAKRGLTITSLMAATYGGAMLFSTALSNSKSASIAALSMLPLHLQNQYLGVFWIVAASVPMIFLLIMHIISMRVMFPADHAQTLSKQIIAEHLSTLGKMTQKERVACLAFVFFFVGSLTSGLHHVNTPSIAGLTILLLLIVGAFSKTDFQKSMDWPMIFFMLSMDSMMRTMAHLGLDQQLAKVMSEFYSFVDGSFILYTLATLTTTLVLRLAFPVAAGMLLSFVILMPVTLSQGYSPWICVFMTAIFSDIWFFRYQNSIYLIIWSSDSVADYDHAQFMRHNMIMNLARVLCVLAAIPFWSWMSLI
ncbi:SLC13 family permease [Zwartia vadi]|uniref:SLC13 family permease n=1 Tax=Zwartia vadi TaxID=3058168 RepID=UPI0025B3B677|nr:SLC13 family permease [Zwartia vadi]MDN3987178.1 SLC13 family permease [Zwartia vadi]